MKIIIKMYKNDYLNKMEYIIDDLMWFFFFFLNDWVKQKKQLLILKSTKLFRHINENALTSSYMQKSDLDPLDFLGYSTNRFF